MTIKEPYIDNQKFLTALKDYQNELKINPKINIPNYIGECFMLIANNIASRHNFKNYTYIDDMISHAVELMVKYMYNFDYDNIKQNPFGYFSKYCFNAFIEIIKKEKKINFKKNQYIIKVMSMYSGIDINEIINIHYN